MGSREAIPSLLKALEDPSGNVRRSATEALGNLGSVDAVPGLLKALEDPENYVRRSAIEALGTLGSREAIPGLLKTLEDSNDYVRGIAAKALGKLGGVEAIPGLLKALEHPDSNVRERAAEALGKLGSSLQLANLWRSRLKNPTDWYLGDAIASIQARCKFYNYEIFQSLATEEDPDASTSPPTIIYDQRGATIGNVAYTVQGNQVTNPAAPDSTSSRETSDDSET